ncbi:hypothetical protein EVAR_86639_1 [Eumeta japonica]|uniref:Uncharacterized protein n=1 Tax=Eumeta variegata TaxID=151549 RepID=A0A4C1Z6Q5_EUMVA|nr:hypothetical protein EVAR_86639_1 [Eumeta japonica]
MIDLAKDLHFDVIAPPTQTYFPNNVRNRPDILDIALMRRVALNVRCIEILQNLNSDHRTVLLKIGPPDGEQPPKNKTVTSWRKVSLLLEETDTPIINNIPDNIETTDEIDYAIGALTNHIATVVEDSSREVPAADSRRKLPEDVRVLLKAKNAAMRRASAYPTCENRSCARALQRKVKARMQEFKTKMEHPHGGNAEPPGLLEVGQGSQIRRLPTNPRPQETGQHVRGRRPGKS